MDCTVKLPIDLLQLPPFRQLRGVLGGVEPALFVWFILWQELGYRVQEGVSPGRLPGPDLPLFLAELEPLKRDTQEILRHLLGIRLLHQDAEDYVCPRFALLHANGGQSRSQPQRGGDVRAYNQRMKHLDKDALQQSFAIGSAKLVDSEGRPLDEQQIKRGMRLIIACDNALHRPGRPTWLFTEGLIHSAMVVLKGFTDEEINLVCDFVARRRDHPLLSGATTERLLPMFGQIVTLLEGIR